MVAKAIIIVHILHVAIAIFFITDYTNELILKNWNSRNEDSNPVLPTPPSPLARQYEHPDKDKIPLFL